MPTPSIFISYGHFDMQEVNWIERLKIYLAPFSRDLKIEIWDDTKITTGTKWRKEIAKALDEATSSILLVGPAFLASNFIMKKELPKLLDSAQKHGLLIYPLIISYCSYKKSILEQFQSFNDPEHPLESLSTSEQNRILNEIAMKVSDDIQIATLKVKSYLDKKKIKNAKCKELEKEIIQSNQFSIPDTMLGLKSEENLYEEVEQKKEPNKRELLIKKISEFQLNFKKEGK